MLKARRRKITAEDLLRLKFLGDPQISPDGDRIAFVVKLIDAEKNKCFSHLWLAEAEGQDGPRQFTFGEHSDSSPRWSPDGKRIAFLRTKDRQTQVWTIAADGGEACQLTRMDDGSLSSLDWSPDGSRLLCVFGRTPNEWTRKAREEREKSGRSNPARVITRLHWRLDGFGVLGEPDQVWVIDARSGAGQAITHGADKAWSPCWSPDGGLIAFVSNRTDPEEKPFLQDVWVISAGGGKPRKLATPPGPKGGLAWAPDGKTIAYVGAESLEDPWTPKNDGVWLVGADGKGKAQDLTSRLNRTVGNMSISDTREAFSGNDVPLWSPDSRRVFFLASDCGSVRLHSVSVRGGEISCLTRGAIDVAAVSSDRSARRFALAMGHALSPGDVYVLTTSSGRTAAQSTSQLTRLNADLLREVQLSRPEEVWYPSGDLKIQGWIMKPPDFKRNRKYPLLLSVHGGPHAQYGNCFFHQFQMHAAEGYVVFYLNPRGSMGRDEEFAACIKGDWGNLDYQDVMAAADYVESLPYVDKSRMSISGGSYGGYMTNWVVGHSNRFKCAITDRSVVNMHSMAGTSDYVFRADGYWKGNMWDNPGPLLQQSPLSHMAKCRTPLLIIHSEGDLRCPVTEADQLYTVLKRLRRKVLYVRYPAETSHGMSRIGPPDLRLDRLKRYSEWFAKHLKG